MSIIIPILIVIHVMVSLLMILLVLMQRPRSEGLGAAFGGGVTDNLFGAQTTNVLQKMTVWLGGGFFAVTLLLAIAYANSNAPSKTISSEVLGDTASQAPIPAATASPAPAAPDPADTTDQSDPADLSAKPAPTAAPQ